jgi:radical SAM protein with 4Fe4S-binding SPASM domain
LVRVVDAIASSGVSQLCLLGGDPASYPYVIELSRHAESRGLEVSILSNTLAFPSGRDEEAARYIAAFETTIHHDSADVHDSVCRIRGAYDRVTTQLRKFADLGKRTGIAVNITSRTADRVFAIVEALVKGRSIPLDYVIIQRIIPFGRATESANYTISRSQVESALKEVDRVHRQFGIEIVVEDPFPLCIVPRKYRKYMHRCEWGFSRASVDDHGNLSRCGADPRYRLGNILETPLEELWQTSEILVSFRSRGYLPGRCRVCDDLERCGGGCALSCEIEKDHSIDYLCSEFERFDLEIHGELVFRPALEDELSSILQIEWGNFPGYGHLFSVESIRRWYAHNPRMFRVVVDEHGWVLAYAAMVPVKKELFSRILAGEVSSISDFPEKMVLRLMRSRHWHLEVLASVPSRSSNRVGRFLIRNVGEFLLARAEEVTASPVTPMGVRLCQYFGFNQISTETRDGNEYPIYHREVVPSDITARLSRF